jgi:hypothetical protein
MRNKVKDNIIPDPWTNSQIKVVNSGKTLVKCVLFVDDKIFKKIVCQ